VTVYAKHGDKTVYSKEYKAQGDTIYFKHTSFNENAAEVLNEYYKVYADDKIFFYDNSPSGFVKSSIDILNDIGDPLAEISRVVGGIGREENIIIKNKNNYTCAELKTYSGEVFLSATNFSAVTSLNQMILKYHYSYDFEVTVKFGGTKLTSPKL
jgi:hypothetical protein